MAKRPKWKRNLRCDICPIWRSASRGGGDLRTHPHLLGSYPLTHVYDWLVPTEACLRLARTH
eukprot:714945-Prorocentrum_minimum.AAC.1